MHRSDQFPRFYITVLKTVSISSFQNFQQLLGCRISKIWRHGSVVSVYFIVSACFSPNYVDFFHVGDFQENWIKGKWTLRPHPSSYSETFWTLRLEIRSGNHDNLVPLSLSFFVFFRGKRLVHRSKQLSEVCILKEKEKNQTWDVILRDRLC